MVCYIRPLLHIYNLLSIWIVFLALNIPVYFLTVGVFKMNYEYWSWWGAFFWFMGASLGALCNVYLIGLAGARAQRALHSLRNAGGDEIKKLQKAIISLSNTRRTSAFV